MSQVISDLRAGGGIITSVQGGNNITVNTVGTVATVNVSGTTNHAVQVGNALGALTSIGIGLAGQVLTSNGPGVDPSFQPAAGGAAIQTVTVNNGADVVVAVANNINLNTLNATVNFTGATPSIVQDFGLSNLVLGSSLPALVSGSQSVGLGDDALASLISGVGNTAIGFNAGQKITTGSANTAVGNDAMNGGAGVVTGTNNVAIGNNALNIITTGSQNTAVGDSALLVSTGGNSNTAIGFLAGGSLVSGVQNTIVGGLGAGFGLTTGVNNTVLGSGAMIDVSTGSYNIVIGSLNSGNSLTTGDSSNIIIGNVGIAGDNNTIRIGREGVFIGAQNRAFIAGIYGVTPADPVVASVIIDVNGQLGTVPGGGSPIQTITGNIGGAQLPSLGNFNIVTANSTVQFSGTAATETLDFNRTNNMALGSSLSALTTGSYNTFIGSSVGANLTTGQQNVGLGNESGGFGITLGSLTTGSLNVALGVRSLKNLVSGGFNASIGFDSLRDITSGGLNTALGMSAGYLLTGSDSFNICIGAGTGGVPGDNNVLRIGFDDGAFGSTLVKAFIAGIASVVVANTNMVTIDTVTGQLGSQAVSPIGTTWSVITVDQTAAINDGYFINKVGTLLLALPAVSAVGDSIEVANINSTTGTRITQAAGQQIFIASLSTTLGVGGTLTSTLVGDTLKLVCRTANTTWQCVAMIGNWTVV